MEFWSGEGAKNVIKEWRTWQELKEAYLKTTKQIKDYKKNYLFFYLRF